LSIGLIYRNAENVLTHHPIQRDTGDTPPPHLPEHPVIHLEIPSKRVPLVFAGPGPHPDLSALAARVANQVKSGRENQQVPQPGGVFGAKQRWYLTRIRWDCGRPGPRLLIRRTTHITASSIKAWCLQPPEDAIALTDAQDGLIDGETSEGETAFYAVLQGPGPWEPLALSPSPPPFEALTQPLLLGDVHSRLASIIMDKLKALESGPLPLMELPPMIELMEAALEPRLWHDTRLLPVHEALETLKSRSRY
jgi:hypothetical protein